MPSILITGASSGIGAAAVNLFLDKGWHVIATMRQPDNALFPPNTMLHLLPLDVTQPDSIAAAMAQVKQLTPTLDVLLNNAGYGLVGPLERATTDQLTQQFNTNVLGLVQMMQAVLPGMRAKKQGIIINVASVAGRTAFPMYSLYHGSKWAVEGLTESVMYELAPLGIRVKLIEPGPIKTRFYGQSMITTADEADPVYGPYTRKVLDKLAGFGQNAPGPEVVAQTIWRAATDGSPQLRYPVNTMGSLWLRRLLPEAVYQWAINKIMAS
jgi:NAD(P)-dependent dehydrogenase (short-subunit alcohol dehydrogenase family)